MGAGAGGGGSATGAASAAASDAFGTRQTSTAATASRARTSRSGEASPRARRPDHRSAGSCTTTASPARRITSQRPGPGSGSSEPVRMPAARARLSASRTKARSAAARPESAAREGAATGLASRRGALPRCFFERDLVMLPAYLHLPGARRWVLSRIDATRRASLGRYCRPGSVSASRDRRRGNRSTFARRPAHRSRSASSRNSSGTEPRFPKAAEPYPTASHPKRSRILSTARSAA